MTMLGSVAALFLKRTSGFKRIHDLARSVNFYLGGFLYLAAALINIYVLRLLDFSVVLPRTSLTYLWTVFLSHWVLRERLTPGKIAGATLIVTRAERRKRRVPALEPRPARPAPTDKRTKSV
jgi:drug/metabolite transporter (DMT)-like permease